jgi:hypothetical protein
MKMEFSPKYSRLASTDYWSSADGAASGRAWMAIAGGRWHALLPEVPACEQPRSPFHRATIMPCRDGQAPQGWSWLLLLRLFHEHQPATTMRARLVPETDFAGAPPRLPLPGTMTKRSIWIYKPTITDVTELYSPPIDERWTAHELAFAADLFIVRPKGDSQGDWRLHDQVWLRAKNGNTA